MELIQKDCIQIVESVENWQAAIRLSAQPLLSKGWIGESYVEAMIQTVNELGAYIVIAPRIAMPHARSSEGVTSTGFGVMKLKKGVYFDEQADSYADLILPLACADDETHIQLLQAIAVVLGDADTMEKLLECEDVDSIYEIFKRVEIERREQDECSI